MAILDTPFAVPDLVRERAGKEVRDRKGFLRKAFEFMDLPGNIVQNLLLKGNWEGALRNLADLGTGLATGGLAGTKLTRDDKDRPDVGFLGEVLLDPLLFISLPGNLTKNIGKNLGKGAVQATSRALTRTGAKAVAREATEAILPRLLKSKSARSMAARVTKLRGAAAGESFLKQLATRRATRQVTRGVLSGKMPKFIKSVREPLVEGGIKFGLPFTQGRSLGLKGHDVLREAAGYTLPGALLKRAPARYKEIGKAAVRKIVPTAFMTHTGKNIALRARNAEGAMKAGWQAKIKDAVGWMPEPLRKEVGRAVGGADPDTALAKIVANAPDDKTRALVIESVGKWKSITSEMADELASQGLIRDRSKLRKWYLPTQLLDEGAADDVLKALAPATDEPVKRFGSTGAKSHYLDDRVFKNVDEMIAAGKTPELDILKAGLMRSSAQAKLISRSKAIRQANLALGEAGTGVSEASRMRHGVSTVRGVGGPGGRFESLPITQAVQRAEQAGQAAEKASAGVRELGRTRPIDPFEVAKLGGLRTQAQKSAAQKTQQVQQIIASTNKFVPKRMRDKFTYAMADDGSHMAVGFVTKKGKPTALGKLTKAADGAFELSNIPPGKNGSAVVAAAYRAGAIEGVPVRMSSGLFHRYAPKLRKLIDNELSMYLKHGLGNVKPSALLDFFEKHPYVRMFKSGVTVGLGPFVNVAFVTRNIMTGIFQAATDPQIGLAGFKHVRPILEGLVDKVARRYGHKIEGGKIFKMLAEDAIQNGDDIGRAVSGIDSVRVGNYTGRQVLDLAKKHAVTRQGYTGVEEIMQATRQSKKMWPQWANQSNEYVENAMRLNGFTEMLAKNVDPEEAAKSVSRAFVDYRYQSHTDRAIRTMFPFSRFTMAQTPVTLEAAARNPALTQPLRALMAGGVGPGTPGWLADAPNIPLGTTEDGKSRVLARTGHPLEDLTTLGGGEGIARTLEQGVAARLHPFARLPLEMIVGKSFFKGQPFGSSVRAPAAMPGPLAELLGGKALPVNKGGTRLPWQMDQAIRAMPVSRQVNEISKLLDKRKTVWARSLDFIAGVKVYDIDEDQELRRILRDYLTAQATTGNIGKVERFFKFGDTDEELTALIKAYYKIGRGTGKRGTKPPVPAAK